MFLEDFSKWLELFSGGGLLNLWFVEPNQL